MLIWTARVSKKTKAVVAVILAGILAAAVLLRDYAKHKPIQDNLMKLYRVKSVVDSARRQQEQTQHRDRDMER